MSNDKQVNIRLPKEEYDELVQEAAFKGFTRGVSSYIRFIVRKYSKICEPNKDGIANG